MPKRLLRFALMAMIVAACLAAGLMVGPALRAGYARLFPPPAFETGDFSHLSSKTEKPVIMFTTSTCPFCREARIALDKMGVSFEEYVIDKSPQSMALYQSLEGRGVPMLIIGDRKIIGFKEDAIRQALLVKSVPLKKPTGH